jgi:predicted Zn-dependent peptidase
MEITRNEIMPGVWLSCLETDKFKSDCLSLSLLTQLDRETISKNALIPRVLSRGTMEHPDMDALSAACDELYGSRILPIVRKKGEILSLGFYAGFIADRFTPGGEPLLESVSALVGELLLSPATRGGLLLRDYVDSEKQKLLEDIRARVNDKRSYAAFRLTEEMCAYEDYGCDDMGSAEGVQSVNYVDLTRHYHDLLAQCPIEIFYCGASSPKRVEKALCEALSTLPRGEINYDLGTDVRMNSLTEEPRFVTEELNVTQGKLSMGFRMGECMADPDFAAIAVFNAIFGGSVTSKLFMNVREKLSLCYYASSSVDTLKGVMLVSSGIEFDNFDAAKSEILAQLDAVRRGDFTDEELCAARRAVASDLRSMTDSPGALEDFYLSQTLMGLDYGPAELAALCEDVTASDVVAIASGIELDTVYFLQGNGESDEEEEDEE